jgi:hypothetical protein
MPNRAPLATVHRPSVQMTAVSKQGRKHRPKPHRRRRRALELLASCADGCTEAILIAHGFTVEQMVELVRIGHATAQTERVIAGGRAIEIARIKITEAGRRALTGKPMQ